MDWNEFKDYARTPDCTNDINDVSDKRKGSTMDFPEQVKEEVHMGWNIKRRLRNATIAKFRAPSFTVPCEN